MFGASANTGFGGFGGNNNASAAPAWGQGANNQVTSNPATEWLGDGQGTSVHTFKPTHSKETQGSYLNLYLQSIDLQPEYKKFNLDELRMQDYLQERIFGENPGANKPQPNNGTRTHPYVESRDKDNITNTFVHYQCITFMPQYKGNSVEELRMEDYRQGLVFSSETPALGSATSGFGSSAFNNLSRPSGFGSTSAFAAATVAPTGFGTNAVASSGFGTSGFGTKSSNGFGATSAPSTAFGTSASSGFGSSTFGATSTPAFGATGASTTAPFGSNVAQTNTAFGFGTAATQPQTGFGTLSSSGSAFGNAAASGFGSNTTSGFGSTPSTGFGANTATGFGNASSSAFGKPTSAGFGTSAKSGFGSATSTGFGASTTTGFGNTSTVFGSKSSTGFGASTTTGFGNTSTGFGSKSSTGFSNTASTGFGANTATGFGSGGFGGQSAAATGFGTNTATGFGAGGFGGQAAAPFGINQTSSSGFGSNLSGTGFTATQPTKSFGGFGQATNSFSGPNNLQTTNPTPAQPTKPSAASLNPYGDILLFEEILKDNPELLAPKAETANLPPVEEKNILTVKDEENPFEIDVDQFFEQPASQFLFTEVPDRKQLSFIPQFAVSSNNTPYSVFNSAPFLAPPLRYDVPLSRASISHEFYSNPPISAIISPVQPESNPDT